MYILLDMNETIDLLAKANGVRWYLGALRKDKSRPMRRALDLKVKGHGKEVDQRKPG